MSLHAIASKRVRRAWEPENKQWHDGALEKPWEDIQPSLHKATMFSLKNVFFFSHATPVQALTLSKWASTGESSIIEAPTGSGKTLAFLLPLIERTLRACESYIAAHGKPPLERRILGVVFAPSRVLAEQTFVVGKSLVARCPYNIQMLLCDGVVSKPAQVLEHLKNGSRGAGCFLVTTPRDFDDLLQLMEINKKSHNKEMEELLKDQTEEVRQRYLAKKASSEAPKTSFFFSAQDQPFVVVVDEADMILNSPEMKSIITTFVEEHCTAKGNKGTRKRNLTVDFAFVGATVGTSDFVKEYATAVCKKYKTTLHEIAVRTNDDFISQLKSKYFICDASNFLPVFIQMVNAHSSKKHFVFFNHFRALQFVQQLLGVLSRGSRPILFINNIFVMYEGMGEGSLLKQYNGFLTHASAKPTGKRPKVALSDAEKKNQIFSSGWKRDGTPTMGGGAILLCTDMAAFGLDVRDVDYVYHFEPPSTPESYIHRIGRVGRMGMQGTSILLLPCIPETTSMTNVRERKTTSTRFNTVTNTKLPTGELQSARVTADALGEKEKLYLEALAKCSALEEYNLPPLAPITATLRNMISQDAKLMKLAKDSALCMCEFAKCGESWFTPKLALKALLLD